MFGAYPATLMLLDILAIQRMYGANMTDPLFDDKIETYDFSVLVNAFDQARAANPALDRWALMNKLLDAHLGAGSDSEALGGDLAYRYGLGGSLAGLALTPVQSILSETSFGSTPQTLQPLADLQNGTIKLV